MNRPIIVIFSSFILLQSSAGVCSAEPVKLDSRYLDEYKENHPSTASAPNSVIPPILNAPSSAGMYPSIYEQTLADALWKAADKAGSLAKTVGHGIGDYMKERQMEKYRQDIVHKFYSTLEHEIRPLDLNMAERRKLIGQIERIYIEDGKTDEYKLDAVHFRDLPAIVRKEYGDILLARTKDGTVDTYTMTGKLLTRWNLKNGKPHGSVVTHQEDGGILYIDYYENGIKLSRKKYTPDGKLEFEQKYDYELKKESEQQSTVSEPDDVAEVKKEGKPSVKEEDNKISQAQVPATNQDDEAKSYEIPVIIH